MAVTANVQEGNGAGPTWTTITTARFCTMDEYNPVNQNPCKVPGAGNNYSYWKHHLVDFSGAFTEITNIKWYCSGSVATNWNLGTGGRLEVGQRDSGDHGCPVASYDQSTGTLGETGDELKHATNGHTYYKDEVAAVADADTFNSSANAMVVDTQSIVAPGKCDAIVYQVKLATDATPGEQSDETFTFMYDEI